jgi:hypothetical protein
MKRISGKRLLNNNWVVPASVLILTLCIGSFALAATGSSSSDPYLFLPPTMTSATSATTATTQVRPAPTSSTASPFLGYQTVATTAPADAIAAAELALEQAKENAILDLIGEKMTPEDKVVFAQLRGIAAEQLLAVTRAQAELQATKAQITALIDKYLGMPDGLSAYTGGTTSSTARHSGRIFE